MPIIYTEPRNLGKGTGNQSLMSDGDPRTYFTASGSIAIPLGTDSINTAIIIAGTGVSVTASGMTPDMNNPVTISGDRTFNLFTTTTPISTTLSVSATGRIYEVYAVEQLLDLRSNNEQTLTTYEPTIVDKDRYQIPDLYENITTQTGPSLNSRRVDSFEVWRRDSNLTACMMEFNKIKNIYETHADITIWAMNDTNAIDYESVYIGHWVSGSLSYTIEGVNAISYTFGVESR